jgi:3-hydroxyacyl-CoA dehydrogenase
LQRIGVVGGGTMGAGIVAACRDAGLPVVLIERDAPSVSAGLAKVQAIYDSAVKRGRLNAQQAQEKMSGVTGVSDYQALADVDLVIEAVFEDLAVKQAVFAALDRVCRADALLATNTSYLDPMAIAAGLSHPERFLGLHFFSPAQVMKLLEIVSTPATAPDTLATGFALARAMNKIPVRSGICDGFIGNRILKTTRAQAERLLLAGASPSAVDAAMRVFGFAMGPFEAQDLGGLDIAAFQRKAARARGETVFAPVAERLCAAGRLGQKTKAGWYDYPDGVRQGQPSPQVEAVIAQARAAAGVTKRDWTQETILDVLLLPMVNEGAKILQEGIAKRAADIDLVKIHGYGFPRWQGGPMHWGQAQGLQHLVEKLDALAQQGMAAPVCDYLRTRSQTGDAL